MTTFLERFLNKKDPSSITYSDLENFLLLEVEENLNLDYKSGELLVGHHNEYIVNGKLDKNKSDKGFSDLAKAIIGFANAEGGLLILGVRELPEIIHRRPVKVRPGSVEPLPLGIIIKEMIESKLRAFIQFPLDDLRIISVKLPNNQDFVCLIDIPQSVRAPHQLSTDHIYYQRRNFFTEPMEHYQVADLFGKRLAPDLELRLDLVHQDQNRIMVNPAIYNYGRAVAKFASCTCKIANSQYRFTSCDGKWEIRADGTFCQFELGVNHVVYPEVDCLAGYIVISPIQYIKSDSVDLNFYLYAESMQKKEFLFRIYKNSVIERIA